ncbi:hemicentin-2-like [Scleropages formosus]|uniref:hemicentin-2-like n=1 Tax=Scleropages formosus TaxID=113540 RepID=UPI0010FA8AC5|nr:hemicentin-2-like [Scleropages formosus]
MSGTFTTCVCGLLGILIWGTGADDCPIEIDPPAVVVKYGDPVSVNCTVFTEHVGMGWVAKQNLVPNQPGVQSLLWTVENLTVWDINPQCFANFEGVPQCLKKVSVTVYNTLDSVSIRSENHTGPLVEGYPYMLVCEVPNVAPVQNLRVKWYKGIEVVDITLYPGESKTPVNVSSTLLITPNRTDDGAQYKCVAELQLGPGGPQPPPKVESELFNITVHYKPYITECPDHKEVEENSPLSTVLCNVKSNLEYSIKWQRYEQDINASLPLTKTDAGEYIFTAKNVIGSVIKLLNITVGYPPEFNCTKRFGVWANESLKSMCTVKAYPEPTITWLKDREKMNPATTLTKRDGGQYIVTASNTYGTVNQTLEFKIFGADDCPIEIDPPAVVVKYGDPVSVNCTVFTEHVGMGWVAKQNPVPNQPGVQSLLWTVENLTVWDINPQCFANFKGVPQCLRKVSVTVYNTPDSVSIRFENHTGPLVEGRQYRLVCEVQNVAPVQNLRVKWYKGIEVVDITLYPGESKTPVNVSSTLLITPNRTDDGAQYKCVAELQLGPGGPQPPPKVESELFNITVHYKPNITSVPSIVPVIRGYSEVLQCTAEGHPPPTINWLFKGKRVATNGTYSVSGTADRVGNYTCIARNSEGHSAREVLVVLKEDYLPLIAGLVAVAVVVILVIFTMIFCIYYKSTKMGHYNLKDRKPCTQNGNVAQNGRDSTFPMKVLSIWV